MMKKITFKGCLSLLVFVATLNLNAQQNKASKIPVTQVNQTIELTEENQRNLDETGYVKCLTQEMEESLRRKFPNRNTTQEFEAWLEPLMNQYKADLAAGRTQRVVYTIPVVVHVIHNGDAINNNGSTANENISDAQVLSQITVLNEDFAKLTGTPGDGTGVDTEIRFCMAQQDPTGNPTDGINRVDMGQASWSTAAINSTVKPATQWDPTKYMNMWSVRFTDNTLLGYAQFPDGSGLAGLDGTVGGPFAANTDGVVAVYSTFGDIGSNDGTFTLNSPYDRGRTMTHEVGHWLGLRHIWGDSNCGTDYCADTPTQQTSSGGNCPATTTCDGVADLTTNYMDYSNDFCMNNFTNDQKTRIQTVMLNSPRRVELATSPGCDVVGVTFSLSTPDSVLGNCGSASVDYTIDMAVFNGFNENTNFTVSGNPAPSTTSFSPVSLNTAGSTTLTVGNLTGIADGTYPLVVTGTSATVTETLNLELVLGTGVCPSVSTVDYLTSITYVEFNTIANTSALNGPDLGTGFSDFTAMSTDVMQGASHDLTVNVNPDGMYRTQTKVWVDWNQDCVFNDTTEEYDLGNTATFTGNDITVNSPLSVVVPANAALGQTIMRVSTIYSDPNTIQYPLACVNNTDGEVEDYTVNVLASLSVAENQFELFNIFPNPTNGNITIDLSTSEDVKVSLYDIQGRIIYSESFNNNTGTFNREIDFGAIASGIYMLNVESAGKKSTKKLVKQ